MCKRLFSVMAVFLMSGCAALSPKFDASVSSYARDDALSKRTYILAPGNPNTSADDLQFQQFSRYIDEAMSGQGFVRAATPEAADIAVVIQYEMGSPIQRTESYSIPQWGQTGVQSAQTYGQVNRSMGTYQATTTYTPSYGITGYTQGTRTRTYFMRTLRLTAFERGPSGIREVWRTNVASIGETADMRAVFPYLTRAAAPYIARDSVQTVNVSFPIQR